MKNGPEKLAPLRNASPIRRDTTNVPIFLCTQQFFERTRELHATSSWRNPTERPGSHVRTYKHATTSRERKTSEVCRVGLGADTAEVIIVTESAAAVHLTKSALAAQACTREVL